MDTIDAPLDQSAPDGSFEAAATCDPDPTDAGTVALLPQAPDAVPEAT